MSPVATVAATRRHARCHMIVSVSGERAVGRIRVSGIKARRGPLRVAFLAGGGAPALVLAVPKRLGTAVVRNRIRRRLKAVFTELAHDDCDLVPAGDYLVGVATPLEHLSHRELRNIVTIMLRSLRTR